MIVGNSEKIFYEFTNCSLGHNAALIITDALKIISALQTLIFDTCNVTKYVADDLAVVLYINQRVKRLRPE